MIERGSLTESDILDSGFFHNRNTETDYTDSTSKILTAASKWHIIQESSCAYNFKS